MARIQRREHISLARDENKFPEEHSGLASGIRHSGGRGGEGIVMGRWRGIFYTSYHYFYANVNTPNCPVRETVLVLYTTKRNATGNKSISLIENSPHAKYPVLKLLLPGFQTVIALLLGFLNSHSHTVPHFSVFSKYHNPQNYSITHLAALIYGMSSVHCLVDL